MTNNFTFSPSAPPRFQALIPNIFGRPPFGQQMVIVVDVVSTRSAATRKNLQGTANIDF